LQIVLKFENANNRNTLHAKKHNSAFVSNVIVRSLAQRVKRGFNSRLALVALFRSSIRYLRHYLCSVVLNKQQIYLEEVKEVNKSTEKLGNG